MNFDEYVREYGFRPGDSVVFRDERIGDAAELGLIGRCGYGPFEVVEVWPVSEHCGCADRKGGVGHNQLVAFDSGFGSIESCCRSLLEIERAARDTLPPLPRSR